VRRAAPRTTRPLGVSTGHAGQLLVSAGQNIERLRGEASFAALCGADPLPASSGKTTRHRLNYGGDRGANRALHLIAVCRLRYCPRTRAYARRRAAEGKGKAETLRCLKRYIARETYRTLCRPHRSPTPVDPRHHHLLRGRPCRHHPTPDLTSIGTSLKEAAGSFLTVGSEIGHRMRRARRVRPEVVTRSRSSGHLRDRAAARAGRLCATASTRSGSAKLTVSLSSSAMPMPTFGHSFLACRGSPVPMLTTQDDEPTLQTQIRCAARVASTCQSGTPRGRLGQDWARRQRMVQAVLKRGHSPSDSGHCPRRYGSSKEKRPQIGGALTRRSGPC
jgi:Transposase IS116/IS110/IS902 family